MSESQSRQPRRQFRPDRRTTASPASDRGHRHADDRRLLRDGLHPTANQL